MSTRRICFTQFNYTEDSIQALLDEEKFSYVVFGKEVCPTTQRPHLQGYAEFHKKARFSPIATKHSMTCTIANGSALDNYNYCTAQGPKFGLNGTEPKNPNGAPNEYYEKGEMRLDGGEAEK